MSMVRVLVGTRKGAFILTSDAKRARWEVSGPLFGGWEIYHLQGAPADPQRLYASRRAAGSGSRSSVPTMEGRRGRRWGTRLCMTATLARISGTTARRALGV